MTGCECPESTTFPSSVLITLSITDCCQNVRTVTDTLYFGTHPTGIAVCLACVQYGRAPVDGGQHPLCGGIRICDGPLFTFAQQYVGCGAVIECADRLAVLSYISIGFDGCTYLDPADPSSPYGTCHYWTIKFCFAVQGTGRTNNCPNPPAWASSSTPALVNGNAPYYLPCCQFPTNCTEADQSAANYEFVLCKTSGTATPIGNYAACTGSTPLDDFCGVENWYCPDGNLIAQPTAVVS